MSTNKKFVSAFLIFILQMNDTYAQEKTEILADIHNIDTNKDFTLQNNSFSPTAPWSKKVSNLKNTNNLFKIKNIKEAINYLKVTSDIDSDKLLNLKNIFDNAEVLGQKSNKFWYYKGVLYTKILKNNLKLNDNKPIYFSMALSSFKTALKQNPNDTEMKAIINSNLNEIYVYFINLGLKLVKLRAFEQAERQLTLVKSINSKLPEFYLFHASTTYLLLNKWPDKDLDEVYKEYKTYLKKGGREAVAYYAIATIFEKNNELKKALKTIQNGIEIHPYNDSLLAKQIKLLRQTDSLKKYEKQILKKKYKISGAKYYHLFKLKQATNKPYFKMLEKSLKYSANTPEPYLSLGIYYFNKASRLSKKLGNSTKKNISKKKKSTKLNKKEKKKLTTEMKIERYLKLAKVNFENYHNLKPYDKFIKHQIKFINAYLSQK